MAKSSDVSALKLSFYDTFVNNGTTNDDIKSISNEIIYVLQLDDNEIEDQIINDLLESGRQSLVKYQEDMIPDIYQEVMDGNENKLIILLKKYFQRQWETQYGKEPNQWFKLFLEENHELCEHVLTRTAEYGTRFMKDCPILSIVLQLLFESIDDQCLKETNIFDNLWLAVTTDGLRSITKYSEYIIPDIMNEQLNISKSTLFQALRIYYRGECEKCGKCEKLLCLLEKSNIRDRHNLYELALDNVAENGWLLGIGAIQQKITPRSYATLLENLHLFLQQQRVSEDAPSTIKNNNTASVNTHSEATLTERTTKSNEKQVSSQTMVSNKSSSSPQKQLPCPRCHRYDRIFRYARLRALAVANTDRDCRDDDAAQLYDRLKTIANTASAVRATRQAAITGRLMTEHQCTQAHIKYAIECANKKFEKEEQHTDIFGKRYSDHAFRDRDAAIKQQYAISQAALQRYQEESRRQLAADIDSNADVDSDIEIYDHLRNAHVLQIDYDYYLALANRHDLDYFGDSIGFHIGDSSRFCFFRQNDDSPIQLCVYKH